MQVFIGLDGGGTACRAQAELEDGQRSAVLTGGAANVTTDFDRALEQIAGVLTRAVEAAQTLAPGATLAAPRVVLGLAGASESGAAARLQAALPYPALTVCGDIDIAVAGALGAEDGIVLAVGTGSVLARQRGGQVLRVGGYGLVLGDEGSGAWIGREALRRTLHARDGLRPAGPLTDALWRSHGPLPALIGFARRASPADFAALAPRVLEHDRAGCPVAGAILDDGCGWLLHAIRHLQAGATDLPVVPLGGLGPPLLERLRARDGAELHTRPPRGTALDGALSTARRAVPTGAFPR